MYPKDTISNSTIHAQLDRILKYPPFKNSKILTGFLEFVVRETLAGRESEIKEYSIGVSALFRNLDFNPQLDAIVRIHAGRLRRVLKEYYHEEGKHDPVLIDIPKGSYIPVFQKAPAHVSHLIEQKTKVGSNKPVSSRPMIAVLPFRNISQDTTYHYFADGLGDQLSSDLSRFNELAVVSYYSTRHIEEKTGDIQEAARLLGAGYLLTGSIQVDKKKIRIGVQLILGVTGEQIWTNSIERNFTISNLSEIQQELVTSTLNAIGGYYGVIFRDMINSPDNHQIQSFKTYEAIYWYAQYQNAFTADVFVQAVDTLEKAVKEDPNYALAWALLGELYLDDKAVGYKKVSDPMAVGLNCVLHAIHIDPNCQHGYMALTWYHLLQGNKKECIAAAEKCLSINPNSSTMMGAMGFAFVCAGEFEKGYQLLNTSVQFNPYYPWWFNIGFLGYHLSRKDYLEAFQWALQIQMPGVLWDPLLKAAILGHLQQQNQAAEQLQIMAQFIPLTIHDASQMVGAFFLSTELNDNIMDGLKRAGLK